MRHRSLDQAMQFVGRRSTPGVGESTPRPTPTGRKVSGAYELHRALERETKTAASVRLKAPAEVLNTHGSSLMTASAAGEERARMKRRAAIKEWARMK